MLRLIANNEYTIELDDDVEIPINITNPFLSNYLAYSFPFSFPVTNNNEKYFNYPYRKHSAYPEKYSFDLRIQFNSFIIAGICQIEDISDNRYEVTFTANEGALYELLGDTYLSQLNYDGLKWVAELDPVGTVKERIYEHYDSIAGKIWPEVEYNLVPVKVPTHNEDLFGDPRKLDTINEWDPWEEKFKRHNIISPVSPFLFVNTIINYIFKNFGIQIVHNDLEENFEARSTLVFPFYVQTVSQAPVAAFLDYRQLVPETTVSDFLTSVEDKFNVTCFIDYNKKQVRIIRNDSLLTNAKVNELSNLVGEGYSLQTKTINNLQFTPRVVPGNLQAAEDYADIFSQRFGSPEVIQSEMFLPEEDSLTASDEGKFYYSNATGIYYRVEVVDVENEVNVYGYRKISSDLFYHNVNGNNYNFDKVALPQINYKKVPDPEDPSHFVLILESQINFIWRYPLYVRMAYGENPEENEYPLTFVYYHYGDLENSKLLPIKGPQGIIAPVSAAGWPIYQFGHSLKYHGPKNIQDTLRKNYINFIKHAGRPIEVVIHFTPEDLANLKLFEQYRIDQENYLIESLNLTLTIFDFRVESAKLCPVKLRLAT